MELQEANLTNCTQEPTQYEVDDTIYRKVVGTLIFVAVWPFIVLDMKWFPVGRPAAALTGGALMVFFTIVPQTQVFWVIGERGNIQTICLLIGMMLLSYYYDREGLLQAVALWIFGKNKALKYVLWKVCACTAILSAIVTNDAACLVVTPLLLLEHARQDRNREEIPPLLLGIATSANIGSAATFFGNPQNAFVAANAEVSLLTFFVTSLPAAIIGLALSIALLYLMYLKTIYGVSLWQYVRRRSHTATVQNDTAHYSRRKDALTGHSREFSLSVSRRDLHSTFDKSSQPYATSQMSQERERMYSGTSTSVAKQLTTRSMEPTAAFEEPQYGTMEQPLVRSADHLPTEMEPPNPLFIWRSKVQWQRNNEPLATCSAEAGITVSSLVEREEGLEDAGGGQTNPPHTWQRKVFVGWLVFVTVALLILLSIPPPPLVSAEFNLGLVPVGAGVMTMLVDTLLNRHSAYDAITKIDWPVIMMFWGLFIWLQGFQNTGFPNYIFHKVNNFMNLSSVGGVLVFTVFVVIGSNILSNVPLVILVVAEVENFHCSGSDNGICPSRLTGILLAWTSTIAGNFSLIGSVANLIVAEKGRTCSAYRLTFWEYLRFGLPSTLVVLFTGLPIVYFAGRSIAI